MAAAIERMILQSDWNEVLKHSGEKTWISFKPKGGETVHADIECQGVSSEGIPYLAASDDFVVQKVTKNELQVTYSNEETCCTRTFVAPVTTFKDIHTAGKIIHSVDVTAGGLGVSSDTEGQLKIWETHTGAVRRILEGHYGDVYTCQFFPSGVVVLSGGADMQLKIWSAETGKCAATLKGHTAGILDTCMVERGRNIVSCGRDGTARLWDCGSQTCLHTWTDCGGMVNCCSVGVTGGQLDMDTPQHTPNDKEVGSEGKLLLLGGENKTLQGYSLQCRNKIFELDCHDAVNCCSFLSDTCVACGTQDGHITVSDIRNIRVPLREWAEKRNCILSILPYRDGFFTSTGDGSCFLVNNNYETTTELTGSDCDPLYKTVSDGKHIYTVCRDSAVRKYRLDHLPV